MASDTGAWVLIAFGVAAVCGICGWLVASRRNADMAGFFAGFLLGPLGVLIAFALDGRAMCPHCHGRINGQPKVCQHCGRKIRIADDDLPQRRRVVAAEDDYVRRMRQSRRTQ